MKLTRGMLAASGADVAYATGAVTFDGATWLINAALNSGADGPLFSFSGWFLWTGNLTAGTVFVTNPEGDPGVGVYVPNLSAATFTNPAGNLSFAAGSNLDAEGEDYVFCQAQYPALETWVHFCGSANVDFDRPVSEPPYNKIIQLYMNDVDVAILRDDEGLATINMMNGAPFFIGSDSFEGDEFNGAMADLWIAPNTFIDFSVTGNRRKFISAAGKPVNLGADGSIPTGTAPAIFQRRAPADAAATFADNLGTGGDFTITGTLTNAPSSPSD